MPRWRWAQGPAIVRRPGGPHQHRAGRADRLRGDAVDARRAGRGLQGARLPRLPGAGRIPQPVDPDPDGRRQQRHAHGVHLALRAVAVGERPTDHRPGPGAGAGQGAAHRPRRHHRRRRGHPPAGRRPPTADPRRTRQRPQRRGAVRARPSTTCSAARPIRSSRCRCPRRRRHRPAGEAISSRWWPDKRRAYVGEQVVVSWYLYLAERHGKYQPVDRAAHRRLLDRGSASASAQGGNAVIQEQIHEGRLYKVAPLMRKALFPLQTGTLTVTPLEAEISQVDFFGRPVRTQRLKAEPVVHRGDAAAGGGAARRLRSGGGGPAGAGGQAGSAAGRRWATR